MYWLMLYHFEIPKSRGFQICKNENQGTPSCEVSNPQFLGHKIKSYPILIILVPNNTHGTLNIPTKYQPSQSTQLRVIVTQNIGFFHQFP